MTAHARHRPGPRWFLLASLMLVVASATGLGVALAAEPEATSGTPDMVVTAERSTDWVDVLAGLDAARSRAFAAGNPNLLGAVYAAGSVALAADRTLMRRYRERGLRVIGLRMDIVDVRLRTEGPERSVLDVRDRIGGGSVVDAAGRKSQLSGDAWSSHRIVLSRATGEWRIAAIR